MLHGHQHCSRAIHDFLELIEHHMLTPEPKNRYCMDEVSRELNDVCKECNNDRSDYCSGFPYMGLKDSDFPPRYVEKV